MTWVAALLGMSHWVRARKVAQSSLPILGERQKEKKQASEQEKCMGNPPTLSLRPPTILTLMPSAHGYILPQNHLRMTESLKDREPPLYTGSSFKLLEKGASPFAFWLVIVWQEELGQPCLQGGWEAGRPCFRAETLTPDTEARKHLGTCHSQGRKEEYSEQGESIAGLTLFPPDLKSGVFTHQVFFNNSAQLLRINIRDSQFNKDQLYAPHRDKYFKFIVM